MTEEQTLVRLINFTIEKICEKIKLAKNEIELMKKSFWEVYFDKALEKVASATANLPKQEAIADSGNTFSTQAGKMTATIREKYLTSETNILLMLDAFFAFVEVFLKNIENDQTKKAIIDIILQNFQTPDSSLVTK